MGKILAGGSALLWLGLFLGQAKKQEAIVDGNHVPQPPEREALLLTLAACLLAGYLTGESFFVAAAMIAGLGFLAWLSSLRIARSSLAYSLLAALSVWTIAWAGYDAGHNSLADFPHPPPPGMPGFQGQQFAGYVPPGMAGEMPAFSGGFDINALDFLSGQPSGPPVFPPGFSPSGRQVALPAWISHPLWLALPATIWAFRVVGRRREKSPVAPTWNELLATDPHLNSRR
jgi:hypothetical protein